MNEFDALFEKIGNGQIDNTLKISIADLLLAKIEEKKNDLGTWEKSLFAQAVSALSTNVGSDYQPTDSWLRLCLVSLEKAMVPKEARNEEYTQRNSEIESISYEMLKNAVKNIKGKLE